MTNVTAIISMLHEPVSVNSAIRRFRQQSVLSWTLRRLSMAELLGSMAVVCWDDQIEQVAPIAEERNADVLASGPRASLGALEAISAARRWSDGWRGGLLWTCDFDLGFHGPSVRQVIDKVGSDAVILVDPSAGLVDPRIIDDLIAHAKSHEHVELCFTQAAPGLGGVLLRPALVDRLTTAGAHPGRLLHYLPDQPMRDPISGDGCAPVPTPVARTTHNFRLDCERQIRRLSDAAIHLNGELVGSDAEDLVNRLAWGEAVDPLPREVVLELNTDRNTSAIFWPGRHQSIRRTPLSLDIAASIFEAMAQDDSVRLTLAGVGDPLLHPQLSSLIDLARDKGIPAIHVETDLLPNDATAVEKLTDSAIDVVSVHLPAMTPATYTAVMGVDRFTEVLENIRRFVTCRHERGGGPPILVPLFTKCQLNLAEMEIWYDQWLKALSAAVITGPGEYGGLVPACGVADMSPPTRKPCSRLWSRLTILSDGRVASCEQDVMGQQIVGDISTECLRDIWQSRMKAIRDEHQRGCYSGAACARCREWHRP